MTTSPGQDERLHPRHAADVRQGNTLRNPLFLNEDGSLRRFDKLAANPMWNQDFTPDVYENDAYGASSGARHPPAPPTGAGFSTCTPA